MKKINKSKICQIGLLGCLLFSAISDAALINRGSGLIYDDALDITWMQDAGYLITSGASATGRYNFADATNWVDNLVFSGYDDWRLPTINPFNGTNFDFGFSFNGSTDRGFNQNPATSELSHMFANNLGNTSYFNASGDPMQAGSETFKSSFIDGETGDLLNINNIALTYWTGVVDDPIINAAWGFNFQVFGGVATGESQLLGIQSELNVWAVRDGDVQSTLTPPTNNTPSTGIPEPSSLGLFGFGLAGFLAVRRQQRT